VSIGKTWLQWLLPRANSHSPTRFQTQRLSNPSSVQHQTHAPTVNAQCHHGLPSFHDFSDLESEHDSVNGLANLGDHPSQIVTCRQSSCFPDHTGPINRLLTLYVCPLTQLRLHCELKKQRPVIKLSNRSNHLIYAV
jgi:hypothetical protein